MVVDFSVVELSIVENFIVELSLKLSVHMQLKHNVQKAPEAFWKNCVVPPEYNFQSCTVQPLVRLDPEYVYASTGWPESAPPLIGGFVIAPAARQSAALMTVS